MSQPQAVHLLGMLLQPIVRDLLRVRQVWRGRTGRIYEPTCRRDHSDYSCALHRAALRNVTA